MSALMLVLTRCWITCEAEVLPLPLQNHFPVSTHFTTQDGSLSPQ